MKKIVTSMFVLAALFIIPSYSYSANIGAMQLSLIEGDVQIYTQDTSDWVAAAVNMPLSEGDRVWVPEAGRAEVLLNDGTALRLSDNSALDILRIEDHSFQFYLDTGHAYMNFRDRSGHLLQMDTPVSSIRAYEAGIFSVDVPDDRSTDVSVERGQVYVESKRGSTRVNEGYTLSLRGDDYADLHPLSVSDGWLSWNQERDRALYEKQYSSRYLPEELSPYSYDFDRYGTWRSVPEYGYVWTPSVVVSAGWAPYRQGRWVWIRGDYVWVPYEPWGWVPYHYGRWIFNVSFGWCWVPPVRGAVYWGPGYVSWVYTPDYVAWVPLAPREIYYGRGYHGPNSVDITRVNVTNIRVKNVYKNVYVNNAVTVVNRDTFVRGRDVPVRVKENPFLKEKISPGSPAIAPVKETRRPALREIKGGKQPPTRIREIKPEERKKERPLVQKRTYSVLNPGSPAREMPVKIEKGKAPKEKAMEPSPERKVYKAPGERTIERPEKQKAPGEGVPPKIERGKAPAEKQVEKPRPPLQQKERGAPPEKESEKPQKQIVPGEKRKEVPEQREMRPGPATKEAPSRIERSKAPAEKEVPSKPERGRSPAEKKIEKQGPAIERKEPGAPPKKESEKTQEQIVPGEKKKEVPAERKNPEQGEMERPGGQRNPMEK